MVALTTVLDGWNPAIGVPPKNLRAGLPATACGEMDQEHRNFIDFYIYRNKGHNQFDYY
ncbi:MAG: hypothetical protein ACFFD2_09480 [Promethearchaeota archaeon]